MPSRRAGDTVTAELQPPRAFDAACRMVVDYLSEIAPMGVWGITRVANGTETMLVTKDTGYGFVGPGTEIPWDDTLCQTMTRGITPRTIPDTSVVREADHVVEAAAARSVTVAAYRGTPIVQPDGQLFGTVCGLNPEPLAQLVPGEERLLDLLSSLLSAVLEADLAAVESARELERAQTAAETDALTGLLNRRGWERWIQREEARFRRFGDPASVIMMDLDRLKYVNDTDGHAAGDRYIRAAADALRASLRDDDALARLGGDEFGMVVSIDAEETGPIIARLETALGNAGVLGSFGFAPYSVVTGFPGACAAADAAMYETKRARRALRAEPVAR